MPRSVREPNFVALRHSFARLRHERAWSYDTLAERSGVTRRTLISIETGVTKGSLDTWFRVAGAFDLRLGDLLSALDED